MMFMSMTSIYLPDVNVACNNVVSELEKNPLKTIFQVFVYVLNKCHYDKSIN